MAARTANAHWEGSLQEGRGQMSLGSGAFEGAYSFKSRFGEEDSGTIRRSSSPPRTPAASRWRSRSRSARPAARPSPSRPRPRCRSQRRRSPTITKVALTTRGRVPGLEDADFQKAAEAAKEGCVVSAPWRAWTRSRSRRAWTPSRGRSRKALKGAGSAALAKYASITACR